MLQIGNSEEPGLCNLDSAEPKCPLDLKKNFSTQKSQKDEKTHKNSLIQNSSRFIMFRGNSLFITNHRLKVKIL